MIGKSSLNIDVLSRMYQQYVRPWNRHLITTVVLIASAFLAYSGSRTILLLLGGALFGAIGAVYIYQNRKMGLLILIFVTFLVNVNLGTGSNTNISSTILFIVALTGLWLIDSFLIKRRFHLADPETALPLLLMLLTAVLAFINGQLPWFSNAAPAPLRAQFGGLLTFIITIACYLIYVQLLDDVIWLKRLTWLFIAIGSIFVLTRFHPSLFRFGNQIFAYGSTTSLFWLWLITLLAAQAFFNHSLDRRQRALLLFLLAIALYFNTITTYDWKSGWVPALSSLMVIVWIGLPKLRPVAILGGLTVIILNSVDLRSVVTGAEDYSLLTRFEAWRILLEIIKVNPFLGLGPANYYWYTPLYSILGYNVSFNSHNNYIDIVAQIGLFGLVFYLWFFAIIGRRAVNMLKIELDGFERAYVIGAIGGLAGTLVAGILGDWVIPFVYNVGLVGMRSSIFSWIFLAGLIALDNIHRKKQVVTSINQNPIS